MMYGHSDNANEPEKITIPESLSATGGEDPTPGPDPGLLVPPTPILKVDHSRDFEFDEPQNLLIEDLADKMGVVGTVMLILSAAQLVIVIQLGIWSDWMNAGRTLIPTILFALIGYWTRTTSNAFDEVVMSEGNDIHHLMEALSSMRRIYELLYLIALTCVVLTVIGIVGYFLAVLMYQNPNPLSSS